MPDVAGAAPFRPRVPARGRRGRRRGAHGQLRLASGRRGRRRLARASRGRLRHGSCVPRPVPRAAGSATPVRAPPVADAAGVAARTASCGPPMAGSALARCPRVAAAAPARACPQVADAAARRGAWPAPPSPVPARRRGRRSPRRCLARPARGGERGAAGVVDGDARGSRRRAEAPSPFTAAGAAPFAAAAPSRLRERSPVAARCPVSAGTASFAAAALVFVASRAERRAAVLGSAVARRAAARGSTARRRPFTHPWPSLCASPSTSFVAGAHFGSGNFR
nr:uncharacterized protein LOC127329306 [Lolium perenne]